MILARSISFFHLGKPLYTSFDTLLYIMQYIRNEANKMNKHNKTETQLETEQEDLSIWHGENIPNTVEFGGDE